ncbi:DUF4900 domain-containing protein [Deinococcus arcticus]|uniref:DUF4900 domain-containing protein n=1 Tax=Deinococcus arcticus TaxID=2136176 RepID=A0A2T3W7Y4_9DEIO|nr:DUF4900 domain-containing protein [Deinococcus arcticus]PTA67853.1 hypothetical protein C8263_10610 [Deinococcus arcticus]
MPPNHRTQGATLIVTLLLVMLMLAVIMSVTAQVTLSTRRSSTDQEATLRAQYAAESGAARVQARLRAAQILFGVARYPTNLTLPQMEADIAALCGLTSLPATLPDGAEVCDLTSRAQGLNEATALNPRVNVLLRAAGAAQFALAGMPGTSETERSRFWSDLFSGQTGAALDGTQDGASYRVTYGLKPTRVVKDSPVAYRVFFQVPAAKVTGEAGGATRRVTVRPGQQELNLLIRRPSLAPNALFTNHHYLSAAAEASGGGIYFTSRTLFSGPVHTNQHFNFVGRPWFGGAVTSAGCPAGQITTGPDGPTCGAPANPGATFNSTFVPVGSMNPTPQAPSHCAGTSCATPQFTQGVNWNASYVQLPENGSDQQQEALLGGINIPGNVSQMQLYQDTIAGQTVQRITYTVAGLTGPVTTQLALGQNGLLQILDTDGQWKGAERQPDGTFKPGVASAFNGVLYVAGSVQNLSAGPNSASGAAVASFAGLTLAASGDINITSSLRYADPPCAGEHAVAGDGTVTPAACANLSTKNILGIYSAQGNVNLMKDQMGMDPSIHAVLMAGTGAVQVDKYNEGSAMGNVKLIGGIIENYYGAFGTFSGDSASTGYGRNFVFDPRTLQGYEPPFFPTARNWQLGLMDSATAVQPMGQPLRLRGESVSATENQQRNE